MSVLKPRVEHMYDKRRQPQHQGDNRSAWRWGRGGDGKEGGEGKGWGGGGGGGSESREMSIPKPRMERMYDKRRQLQQQGDTTDQPAGDSVHA